MAKRFIGIDVDRASVRIVLAREEKGELLLLSAEERPFGGPEELAGALREILGEERHLGDRLAAALPAGAGFFRRLSLPFADRKKIEAALLFQLADQLPIPLEECLGDYLQPLPEEEGGYAVGAAAVRIATLQEFLEPFDAAEAPLQTLDLAPFAYVAGLRSRFTEGLLVCLCDREATVTLVREGRLVDYRLLPEPGRRDADELLRFILRESAALQRKERLSALPLYLIGPGATDALRERLRAEGEKVEIPLFVLNGREVGPKFLPAVALAARAASEKEKRFNFRRGPFSLKSEWAALKRQMVAAGVLLTLTLLALAGDAWLNYAHRAGQAEALRQEMTRVFRETFPGPQPIVDIPLQMTGKIRELRKRSTLFGLGSSPLAVLNEISRAAPAEAPLDIRDFAYTPESVRLEGATTTFEAVNRLAASLGESPLFAEVQIAEAKSSLDGSRIEFRLTLTLSGKGGTR